MQAQAQLLEHQQEGMLFFQAPQLSQQELVEELQFTQDQFLEALLQVQLQHPDLEDLDIILMKLLQIIQPL